jgi:RNA-directed DNA polymerase
MSTRRQDLYDRIRATSKDEVVLEEMVRLGFWPRQGTMPHDPADEVRRRGEIERELTALRTEQSRLTNLDALRKEALKRRIAEAKLRRTAARERRERERLTRANEWKAKQQIEIGYLGPGVSGGLADCGANDTRLSAQGLPVLRTAAEIAESIGIGVPALRFLAFDRRTSTVSHYKRFTLPKKAGGVRVISAPMPRLKRAQHWILHNILERVALHDAAHGFRSGRSIVSNALPHVGADLVLNVDLRDFFPSVSLVRIKGAFRALGYGDHAATILALLCSEPAVSEVALDGKTYFVASGERRLPQGAPTSPALTNIICRRLDRRLLGAARKHGFVYTRYADDLTLSSNLPGASPIQVLAALRWIVAGEGFTVHPKKTRILRKGARREVTGLVVNERVAVDRATRRRFRAFLFQLEKDGPAGKHWGESPDVFASALGFAAYVQMVDPKAGATLLAQTRAIARKYGWKGRAKPAVMVAVALPIAVAGASSTAASAPGNVGEGGAAAPSDLATSQPAAAQPPAGTAPTTKAGASGVATAPGSTAPGSTAPDSTAPGSTPAGEPKKKWWKLF